MSSILGTLTDEQLAAVTAETDPIVVSAGPGSGKTRVLAARAAWLIGQGIDPTRILCLTFTRSACDEIRSRIGDTAVDVFTFHALAARHVLANGQRVATEIEADAALRSLYDGPSLLPKRARPRIEAMRRLLERWEAGSLDELTPAARTIRSRLSASGLVATWDLLPRLAVSEIGDEYDHVLVDEAQDLTPREAELVTVLCPIGLFLVGDEAQSIMGFRGATADILTMGGPASHRLTRTFRFGPAIAEVANQVADFLRVEHVVGAEGTDSTVQVFDPVPDLVHVASSTYPAGTAILCRTNRQCEAVERVLGGLGVHVKRDPTVVLDEAADHFGTVARSGRIAISTIHAAKGREWDHVVVLASETVWGRPWPRLEDEELRALYVSVTRAKRMLSLDQRVAAFIEGDR